MSGVLFTLAALLQSGTKRINAYDENSETDPIDAYGKAKLEAEKILNDCIKKERWMLLYCALLAFWGKWFGVFSKDNILC